MCGFQTLKMIWPQDMRALEKPFINDVILIALGVKNEPEAVVKDEPEPCPEIKEEPFSHNQSQDGTSPDDEVFADFLSQFYK